MRQKKPLPLPIFHDEKIYHVLASVLPVYLIDNAGYNWDSAALGWLTSLADENAHGWHADVRSHT